MNNSAQKISRLKPISSGEDYIGKISQSRADVLTENRMRILRLIKNMTLGRNAVGYLTESMHGAGSPQARRIQIARQMQIEFKKQLAKELAGIEERKREQLTSGLCTKIRFSPLKRA